MAGATALLRSAASTRKKVLAQQDAAVAYEYANSIKTYDQYIDYYKYLESRSRSASDPGTALSIRKTADSAYRGYVSNEIQRSAINIMQGNESLYDKYDKLNGFFQQAQDLGQFDLAQSLIAQMGQVKNTIESQAESSANAARTLALAQESYDNKVAKAGAAANASMAQSLENGLVDLTAAYNRGGQVAYNKAAKKFVDDHRDMLKQLGIDLPADYSTNIGQLISGTIQGIGKYYGLASQAVAITDPEASASYLNKAAKIVNGDSKFKTPAGEMSLAQASALGSSPNQYIESMDANGLKTMVQSARSGYQVDSSGKIITNYTGLQKQDNKNEEQQKKQLKKLGFVNPEWDSKNGVWTVSLNTAQDSPNRQNWLKGSDIGTTDNARISLVPTGTGYQIYDQGNNSLYNIALDSKGLAGLYKIDAAHGAKHITGQYGFDQGTNMLTTNLPSVVAPRRWSVPMKTTQQLAAQTPALAGNAVLAGPQAAIRTADPLNVIGHINNIGGRKPSMVQRAGGGYNFTDANGNPISALTYAKQTGQTFRGVLASMTGDSFAQAALQHAGNDAAYNPATVTADLAKNWSSLIWGNQVNLQTPQVYRTQGISMPAAPVGALQYAR